MMAAATAALSDSAVPTIGMRTRNITAGEYVRWQAALFVAEQQRARATDSRLPSGVCGAVGEVPMT